MLCRHCPLRPQCLPALLSGHQLSTFEKSISQFALPAQRVVFREGDAFASFYAVRDGVLRVWVDTPSGAERVIRFPLPGDICGIPEVHLDKWLASAATLTNASMCRIPKSLINSPRVNQQLAQLTGTRLRHAYERSVLNGASIQRVAMFLLDLGERLSPNPASMHFNLPMRQADIASYLGISMESVNRALRNLAAAGLISHRARRVRVLEASRLKAVAEGL